MARVLVVDDDQQFLASISETLRLLGHEARTAPSLADARDTLADERFDLVILDFLLPDGSGMELLDTLARKAPRRIAVVTGAEGVRDTIRRLSGPQLSFLLKPIDLDQLKGLLAGLDDAPAPSIERHFDVLIGQSAAMQQVYGYIDRVAGADISVLVLGDSGTGKELVAEALHRASRRSGAFVAVNCGAFNRELIGSELFGHEKGAFTGAASRRAGCFERAAGGTLFLDEISEMPIDLQPTFLRVLETGTFTSVGGEEPKETDARIVAASNQDPATAVEDGKLREDLYYRLAQFTIELPPLVQRGDDVIELARAFLIEHSEDGMSHDLDDRDEALLRGHGWPGNVRELSHVIQRAVLLRDLETGRPALADAIAHAPALDDDGSAGVAPGRSIAEVERELIEATLEHFDGDKKQTASTLGISLKTLYNRLKAYDAED